MDRLEGRALLSQVPAAPAQVVTELYADLLHREPSARGEDFWVHRLNAGESPEAVAVVFLDSREYGREHPGPAAFVAGLYRDVLRSEPDPAGLGFWTGLLHQGVGRTVVARDFLEAPGSVLGSLGATAGGVTSVNTNKPWATGITGTIASTAGAFNQADAVQPAVVTISVTAAGTYVLDQGRSGFITNNTGRTWVRFTLAILSTSTARPSFVSSSDLTAGQFPAPTIGATTVAYANGSVPSRAFPPFSPYTTIRTTTGGTMVIQETPGY